MSGCRTASGDARGADQACWIVRKGSPKLKAEIDAFAKKNGQGTLFGNKVEIVAARRIGAETTTYVANIYKYYVHAEDALPGAPRGGAPLQRRRPNSQAYAGLAVLSMLRARSSR